jgi:hypothetical protein
LLTILNKSHTATKKERREEVRERFESGVGRRLRDDGSNEHKIDDTTKIKEDSCVIRFFAIITKIHFVFRWSKEESSGHSDEQSRHKHRIVDTSCQRFTKPGKMRTRVNMEKIILNLTNQVPSPQQYSNQHELEQAIVENGLKIIPPFQCILLTQFGSQQDHELGELGVISKDL